MTAVALTAEREPVHPLLPPTLTGQPRSRRSTGRGLPRTWMRRVAPRPGRCLTADAMRRAGAELRRQTRRFAAAWSWRGTVSAAASTSTSPIRCRSRSRRCGPRSIRRSRRSPTAGTKQWRSMLRYPAGARELSRALPRRRADQADAAAAAVRRRRLQLPAPGSLRRARVSAAGHGAAVAAGRGFHRRRVRAHRAAAAHAVARRGRAARAGRGGDLSRCITGRCEAPAASTGSTCATA